MYSCTVNNFFNKTWSFLLLHLIITSTQPLFMVSSVAVNTYVFVSVDVYVCVR